MLRQRFRNFFILPLEIVTATTRSFVCLFVFVLLATLRGFVADACASETFLVRNRMGVTTVKWSTCRHYSRNVSPGPIIWLTHVDGYVLFVRDRPVETHTGCCCCSPLVGLGRYYIIIYRVRPTRRHAKRPSSRYVRIYREAVYKTGKKKTIRGLSNKTNNMLYYGYDTFHNAILPSVRLSYRYAWRRISEFLSNRSERAITRKITSRHNNKHIISFHSKTLCTLT